MLPGEDGYSILENLKKNQETKDIPVIMVTAKEAEYDKVRGLDSGADDYITKPFGMMEFIARVKAVLRRVSKQSGKKEYTYKGLTIHVERHQVFDGERQVELTLKEFELLRYLMENQGIVLSRDQILEKIWGYDSEAEINVVWVYISYLRKKLSALHADIQIKATRNAGYSLEENPS